MLNGERGYDTGDGGSMLTSNPSIPTKHSMTQDEREDKGKYV
jgi:hypothetical protein